MLNSRRPDFIQQRSMCSEYLNDDVVLFPETSKASLSNSDNAVSSNHNKKILSCNSYFAPQDRCGSCNIRSNSRNSNRSNISGGRSSSSSSSVPCIMSLFGHRHLTISRSRVSSELVFKMSFVSRCSRSRVNAAFRSNDVGESTHAHTSNNGGFNRRSKAQNPILQGKCNVLHVMSNCFFSRSKWNSPDFLPP